MTIKLRCAVCEEITEHDVLKRYREYSNSMLGLQVPQVPRTRNDSKPTMLIYMLGLQVPQEPRTRNDSKPTMLIYKCIKCGREVKMLDVFLEWMNR